MTWTKEEFLDTVQSFQQSSRELFLAQGEHMPLAFVFGTKNPVDGEAARVMVPVIPSTFGDDAAKECMIQAVQTAVQITDAVGVVFISEVWVTTYPKKEGQTDEEALAEVQQRACPPSEHPERKEALMLTAEHSRFGCKCFQAEITRDADGKPALGPWEDIGAVSYQGRFMHLLPQVA